MNGQAVFKESVEPLQTSLIVAKLNAPIKLIGLAF
jgi:hypothetical protein